MKIGNINQDIERKFIKMTDYLAKNRKLTFQMTELFDKYPFLKGWYLSKGTMRLDGLRSLDTFTHIIQKHNPKFLFQNIFFPFCPCMEFRRIQKKI